MANSFKNQKLTGFDKTLVLYQDGYVARPVTVDKATISDLQPNEAGKYIIPQGTLLTGVSGSLLENPQQKAVQAQVSATKATVTINSAVVVTAKESGDVAYKFALVKDTKATSSATISVPSGSISYDASQKKFTVTLAVNKSGTVLTTYGDVVALINNDTIANTYVSAELDSGVKGTQVADVTSADATTSAGGDESVTGLIDGILVHSIDVTAGETAAAMMIAGYVNVDNMPFVPSTAVKAKLPHIVFSRID